MTIRKAEEKDITRIIELLGQVLQIHADIRPDIFIPGTTKYTVEELTELLKNKDKPSFKVLQKQAREDSYLYSAENYAKSCLKVYDKAIKEYPIVKYRKRDKRKDSN